MDVRTIQTFVLRLLVDTDHPEVIRGALQAMNEAQGTLTFQDEAALVSLLKRLVIERLSVNSTLMEKEEGNL